MYPKLIKYTTNIHIPYADRDTNEEKIIFVMERLINSAFKEVCENNHTQITEKFVSIC